MQRGGTPYTSREAPLHYLACALTLRPLRPAGVVQCSLHGTRWASAEMEAQDERNDGELFRAVVTSMAEWHLRKLSSHR